jgi:hypothetical protein
MVHMPFWMVVLLMVPPILFAFTAGLLIGLGVR